MSGERDDFLSRWSRLKQEAKAAESAPSESAAPQAAADAGPPPELPPVESLSIDSDFRAFLHPKVDEKLRRAALRKLFSDPAFNVMDGLDVYIDDYSKPDPLPAAMLAQLKQAQRILDWAQESRDERERSELSALAAAPPSALPAATEVPAGAAEPDAGPVESPAEPMPLPADAPARK